MVNITHPTPEQIFWPDLIECLVKIPRFGGATFGVMYTVAQHCCLMHDHADDDIKPAALLKNFHKAILGEMTWAAEAALLAYSTNPDALSDAAAFARDQINDAIFRAAGLGEFIDNLESYDRARDALEHLARKLQATEARDLMQLTVAPPAWANVKPFPRPIRPWGSDKARQELETRLSQIGIDPRA
ncbi:MAG: hypothetical protein ABJG14_22080 [Sulfitobacter sp.]